MLCIRACYRCAGRRTRFRPGSYAPHCSRSKEFVQAACCGCLLRQLVAVYRCGGRMILRCLSKATYGCRDLPCDLRRARDGACSRYWPVSWPIALFTYATALGWHPLAHITCGLGRMPWCSVAGVCLPPARLDCCHQSVGPMRLLILHVAPCFGSVCLVGVICIRSAFRLLGEACP